MELRMIYEDIDMLTVVEETPQYYCYIEVDVLDKRETDAKPKTMQMFYKVESRNVHDGYSKMHSILNHLGYQLCGQGALEIREVPNDALDRYKFGLPTENK